MWRACPRGYDSFGVTTPMAGGQDARTPGDSVSTPPGRCDGRPPPTKPGFPIRGRRSPVPSRCARCGDRRGCKSPPWCSPGTWAGSWHHRPPPITRTRWGSAPGIQVAPPGGPWCTPHNWYAWAWSLGSTPSRRSRRDVAPPSSSGPRRGGRIRWPGRGPCSIRSWRPHSPGPTNRGPAWYRDRPAPSPDWIRPVASCRPPSIRQHLGDLTDPRLGHLRCSPDDCGRIGLGLDQLPDELVSFHAVLVSPVLGCAVPHLKILQVTEGVTRTDVGPFPRTFRSARTAPPSGSRR